MPFQDDTGINYDVRRGPLWGGVAAFAAQIERVIAVNVAWSVHLFPSWLALANPDWPMPLRWVGLIYTGAALVPATGFLYGMAAEAAQHTFLNLDLAREVFTRLAIPSFISLFPLFSLFGFLLVVVGSPTDVVLIDALARLGVLLLLVSAHYWGPLFVRDPRQNAVQLLWRSGLMVWRYPVQTLLLSGVVIIILFFSLISVAGLFLAGPVLIALLQIEMVRFVQRRRPAR
jgi:hypothetical protein